MAKTAKMNPEVKAKWVNALTSGEYKQTTDGYLVSETSVGLEFCALGVLADIRRKELKKGLSFFNDGDNALSMKVAKWAGLDKEGVFFNGNVIVNKNLRHPTMIEMNDDAEYSFKKIAKIINTNL